MDIIVGLVLSALLGKGSCKIEMLLACFCSNKTILQKGAHPAALYTSPTLRQLTKNRYLNSRLMSTSIASELLKQSYSYEVQESKMYVCDIDRDCTQLYQRGRVT